ncbi:unnamed protein product [Ectocarpus sp. CCAP 1310/34]|nr:unnamed protein product [Ectocarpus sp. CCAP 1310/34]
MVERHSDRAHPARSGGHWNLSRSLRMCPCAHAVFGHGGYVLKGRGRHTPLYIVAL